MSNEDKLSKNNLDQNNTTNSKEEESNNEEVNVLVDDIKNIGKICRWIVIGGSYIFYKKNNLSF